MGYDAKIKINGELDQKYQPFTVKGSQKQTEKWKTILLGTCMTGIEKREGVDMKSFYDNISMFVDLISYDVSEEWKHALKETLEENDNEYNVCGWSYSDRGLGDYVMSKDEYIAKVKQDLFLYSISLNVNFFEDEECWQRKLSIISETIEGIEETLWDILDHEFFREYKNKEGTEFEDDY